jgi:hypothetical protein
VKKTPAVGPPAGTPEYTRTWSIAMSTMTSPRKTSIPAIRPTPALGRAGGE